MYETYDWMALWLGFVPISSHNAIQSKIAFVVLYYGQD